MPQDFGIELKLVAEVVVDERDIHPGAGADLTHGRGLIAEIGKNMAGGIEQFRARAIEQRGLRDSRFRSYRQTRHVNDSLK